MEIWLSPSGDAVTGSASIVMKLPPCLKRASRTKCLNRQNVIFAPCFNQRLNNLSDEILGFGMVAAFKVEAAECNREIESEGMPCTIEVAVVAERLFGSCDGNLCCHCSLVDNNAIRVSDV